MSYRIKDWDELFETSETKKLKRMSWVPIPNKHDGLGYRTLVGEENGFQHYAAWVLILQVASKCPKRGLLVDSSNRSFDANDLAIKTGAPAKVFYAAFPHLCKVGWLEEINKTPADHPGIPADHPGTLGDSAGRREGTGREGREGNSCADAESLPKGKRQPASKPKEKVTGPNWGALWCKLWGRENQGGDYKLLGPDFNAIRELQRLFPKPEHESRLKAVMLAYLSDRNPYLNQCGWPLNEFLRKINAYMHHDPGDPEITVELDPVENNATFE